MRERRAKTVTIGIGVLCAMVVVASLYTARGIALEYWLIHKLETADANERADAARRLGELRSVRAVPALVEAVRWKPALHAALLSLCKIFPEGSPEVQAEITKGLLFALKDGSPEVISVIHEVGLRSAGVRRVLGDALAEPEGGEKHWVAVLVALAWPSSRDVIASFLSTGDMQGNVAFFATLLPPFWDQSPKHPLELRARPMAKEIAFYFARHHADPKVRALAMSFTVFRGQQRIADRAEYVYDPQILREVFQSDPDELVKRAALRIAGFLGHREGNIELKDIVLNESDPELLVETIQARDLWSRRDWIFLAFYLFDGLPCTWIPDLAGSIAAPWSLQEIARLEALLAGNDHTRVRDAASMAIAGRFSTAFEPKDKQLKVHEWGVWQDAGEILTPAQSQLYDLPGFVHRSKVSAENLWSARSFEPVPVFKPVVFFYAPKPMAVLLRVAFHGGRPWTYYPQATDYIEEETVLPYETADPPSPRRIAPFMDGGGLSPPCLTKGDEPTSRVKVPAAWISWSFPVLDFPGELQTCFNIAPWTIPRHPSHATRGSSGTVHLAGIGLEWCGLRIGYGQELEGEMAPVKPDSWWSYLREVPCSTVALRGNHEKFLFYDGSIRMPSRLKVEWDGEARTKLVLTAAEIVPGALVIRKHGGEAPTGAFIGELEPAKGAVRVALESLDLRGAAIFDSLGKALEAAGLTHPETVALLRTWEPEFLRADGVRVISILARAAYDLGLPLTIYPVPGELVRVGLVWKEL